MTVDATDVSTLWSAVQSRYVTSILARLTNVEAPEATSINSTVGQSACTTVLGLWPAYAQIDFDRTNDLHIEVAVSGVIAELWRRGGSASSAAKVEWEQVWGSGGMVEQLRRTDPRSHRAPQTNSGVQQTAEDRYGRKIMGWSDIDALPHGVLPRRRLAD